MTMSSGSEAIGAFDWLRSFFGEVAGIAREVDCALKREGFVSAYDDTCIWERSNSILQADLWLPRWMLRVYVERTCKSRGPAPSTPYWGFLGMYLRPRWEDVLPAPVAAWGVVLQENLIEPVDRWKPAEDVGLASADPFFLSSVTVENWQGVANCFRPKEFALMEYMARPVVDLRTTDAVKRIVTVPLVARLKGLQRDVARRIAEA